MMAIKIIFAICGFCYLLIRILHNDKKGNHISITIYKDNNSDAARSIWLTFSDSFLYMTEQDYGPLVEYAFGNSCHERYLSNISAEVVRKAVNADSNVILIDKLKAMFGTNSGFDDFAIFMRNNDIEYEYGSY